LPRDITDKTYSYNVGDIATSDIRVQRDIYFIKESEKPMLKAEGLQSGKLVFVKDTTVLLDNLKMVEVIFGNIVKVLEDYPP
jgi:hypothetical protein